LTSLFKPSTIEVGVRDAQRQPVWRWPALSQAEGAYTATVFFARKRGTDSPEDAEFQKELN
jgi:hypothetical protein